MIKDKKLQKIFNFARKWAENYAAFFPKEFETDLTGMCAIASSLLSEILHSENIDHKICIHDQHTFGHCFIKIDDKIIDITATQFSIPKYKELNFSKIEIREIADIKSNKLFFWQITKEFNNAEELLEYQKKNNWPQEHRIDRKAPSKKKELNLVFNP